MGVCVRVCIFECDDFELVMVQKYNLPFWDSDAQTRENTFASILGQCTNCLMAIHINKIIAIYINTCIYKVGVKEP